MTVQRTSPLRGMSVGGVDPSILRELSGVYKPFIKAFKELISNAFDADADNVAIQFSDDFREVTIEDDGRGMSPLEFRYEFTRIGGSSRSRGKTKKGRERIGNKGIGFLALARYCDRMVVESRRPHVFKTTHQIEKTSRPIDIEALLGVPIDTKLLRDSLECDIRCAGKRTRIPKYKYRIHDERARLSFNEDVGPVDVAISVNCRNLSFRATLDFARLLKLADKADLEKLPDFTSIEVSQDAKASRRGTRIIIQGLKRFVSRELQADRRKGYVRNIASRSGLEQFHWHLSRCSPIAYADPAAEYAQLTSLIQAGNPPVLAKLELQHGTECRLLLRPVYPFETDAATLHDDMIIPVEIDDDGFKARGFVAGYESVVFPAEYRGVSIRVRGVAIGQPTFLGAEYQLTGAHKAALSQITGEINVVSGLDAVDSLNPGRESFYEESNDFLTLRRHFLGDGERVGGYLGRTIDAVLRRSQARSSLSTALGRAGYLRRAMDDVSAGITHLVSRGGKPASSIRRMLKSTKSHVNGLASAKPASFGVPVKVAGMKVRKGDRMPEPAKIDYHAGEVVIDASRPEWSNSIVLFKRRFEVVHMQGNATQPIAEVDFLTDRILVNWGHPAKSQMDERGFLRTALAWVLSRTAAAEDADQMMEMAITLLSFSTQPND